MPLGKAFVGTSALAGLLLAVGTSAAAALEQTDSGATSIPTIGIRMAQQTANPIANLRIHKVAIHVDDNDPKVMNLALNNVRNIFDYYTGKGEKILVEIVAYGPGLHMFRADTSPVKHRIAEMSLAHTGLSFSACGNTQANMTKQEGKPVPLLSESRVVPSGVVRLIELQQAGYAYIRP